MQQESTTLECVAEKKEKMLVDLFGDLKMTDNLDIWVKIS